MSTLTEEQRQRMEANRMRALALRTSRREPNCSVSIPGPPCHAGPSTSGPPAANRLFPATNKRLADGSFAASSSGRTYNNNNSNNGTNFNGSSDSTRRPAIGTTGAAAHNCRPRANNNWKPSGGTVGASGNSRFAADARSNSQFSGANKPFGNNQANAVPDVHLSLISTERFQVVMPYNYEVIQVLKTINTRQYDAHTKRWHFSLMDYSIVVSKLKPFCDSKTIVLQELPSFIRNAFAEELLGKQADATVPNFDLSRVDSVLVQSLFPFQRDGINFAISKHGRILFADEMGLGKTIQALGTAAYYREDWPILVVAPVSVRYNWVEAIKRWLPSIDPDYVFVINTGKDWYPSESRRDFAVVASYDALGKVKQLQEERFQIVIVDESHNIKNFKTHRYKSVAPVLKGAKRVMLLTGTPALSRPEELFTQIDCVKPRLFFSFQDFANRYCEPKQHKWGMDYSGASNMEELNLLLRKTLLIRRLKTEVLSQLPTKTRDMVVLDKSSVKHNLKSLRKAAKQMARTDLKGAQRHSALLTFFSETAHAKLEAVSTYIEHLLDTDTDRKFIVFSHHSVMMDEVSSLCSRKDVNFIRIDGRTNALERKKLCNNFQSKPGIRVAVLSIKACNSGITLTAANLVIFAELFWNPGILVQAEDRAHRVGQIDNVQVQYLVAKGTADDDLWPLIQQKLHVLTKVGLGKDDFKDASTRIVRDSEQEAQKAQKMLTEHFPILDAKPNIPEDDATAQTSIKDYMKRLVEDPLIDPEIDTVEVASSNPDESSPNNNKDVQKDEELDDDDLLLKDLEDDDDLQLEDFEDDDDEESAAQIESYAANPKRLKRV